MGRLPPRLGGREASERHGIHKISQLAGATCQACRPSLPPETMYWNQVVISSVFIKISGP